MIELPNLPLIMERHCNKVRENIDPHYVAYPDDLEANVFFEGPDYVPGQEPVYASVIIDTVKQVCSVFAGNEWCYSVQNPTMRFYKDVADERVKLTSIQKYFSAEGDVFLC